MSYNIEPVTLAELAQATEAVCVFGDVAQTITAVSTDSRNCDGKAVFVALSGERFDGNLFIEDACKNGASGYISDGDCSFNNCDFALKVENTRDALLRMAAFYRNRFNIDIIGLTGSVGKTTTKDLITCVLSEEKKVIKTQGNFNNEIGLPLTLFGIRAEHDIGVIEMGMSNFGEISRLTRCTNPDVAIITNIGESHIENLKSREGILQAKCEIFEGLGENGIAVLNGDDELLFGIKGQLPFKTIYCGIENATSDIVAGDIKSGNEGISFTVDGEEYFLNLMGKHNVMNALLAIAVGRIYGLSDYSIKKGLQSYKSEGIRQSITVKDGVRVITDCYNAAPKSVKAAIDVLCDLPLGRKIAVLGDMAELGEISGQYHFDVGGYAAEKGVDLLVLLGNFAEFTAKGAETNNLNNVKICNDKEEARIFLKDNLKEGDAVLFKGSRVMKLEELAKEFN